MKEYTFAVVFFYLFSFSTTEETPNHTQLYYIVLTARICFYVYMKYNGHKAFTFTFVLNTCQHARNHSKVS